jgi:hypothetical protein
MGSLVQIGEEVRGPWVEGRLLRTMMCISTTTSTPLPVLFGITVAEKGRGESSRLDMLTSVAQTGR